MLSPKKLRHLRSMVPDGFGDPYFDEALACYKVGAYRACTVMVANAVFGSLFRKIQHLAGINGKYRKIFDDANYARGDGSPFEQALKQDLEKAELISTEQVTYLEELRICRNALAHPTDLPITASKAGYFLEEGVRLFLSERSFNAYTVIHEIQGRLQMPGFFPAVVPARQVSVVREEMEQVSRLAYHNLVRLVVALLDSDHRHTHRNASDFLRSCALLNIPDLRSIVVRHLFLPRLGKQDSIADPHTRAIWNVVCFAPGCVNDLTDTQQQQLDMKFRMLCEQLESSDDRRWSPIDLFGRILKKAPALIDTVFKETSKFVIRSYPDSSKMLEGLTKLGTCRSLIVSAMRLRALSPRLNEARDFLEFADSNAERLASILDGCESYALLLSLGRRTETSPVAGCRIEPLLRQNALEWFQSSPSAAGVQARRIGLPDPELYWQPERISNDTEKVLVLSAA